MILFKNAPATMAGVLQHQKHASHSRCKAVPGEIILVQENKGPKRRNRPKSVRWVMEFVRQYEDTQGESNAIWGKQWKYIIQGKNLRPIEPFDINELQVTDFDYGSAQTFAYVTPDDEAIIRQWLQEAPVVEGENDDLADEYVLPKGVGVQEAIDLLNEKLKGRPGYQQRLICSIRRPTKLKSLIVERDGTQCRICGNDGFTKRAGGNYCELHHMIELNQQAPDTLQSWNVLVVCPTCHRQLHYGKVETAFLNPGWRIVIDDREYLIY